MTAATLPAALVGTSGSDYWFHCWRKAPYSTPDEAARVVRAMWCEHGVSGVQVYHCRYAQHWHVGKRPKRRRA